MNWRVMLLVVFLPVLLVGNIVLAYFEKLPPTEEQEVAASKRTSKNLDMKFLVTEREENLTKFGFTEEEVAKTIARIKSLTDRYEVSTKPTDNLILRRLNEVDEQDDLVTALCTGQNEIRPWFTSLKFLVIAEKDGSLKALEYDAVGSVEPQEWYRSLPIEGVVGASELSEEPKPDAIKMAIAAVLLGKGTVDKLIKGESPFGSGMILTGWSWDTVKKQNKGIAERTLEWAAVFHLTEEVAFSEKGPCYDESSGQPVPQP